ncbi:MAG: 50S ribosomal protein L11 methyltransferase [Verrucomicrobia bacterium]|nr:50S ribosomal protein L11 methyltransferase [Verrucomicrobiota bacterium]
MKTGPLWSLSVETTGEAEEAVMHVLERLFAAPASSCTDAETGAVTATVFLEWKEESSRPDRNRVASALQQIRKCGLEVGPGRVAVRRLRAKDWAESWKRHFKPIEVGGALLIKPSWSRRQPKRGQTLMVLDPGLSFGTGQHPTTAFCLEQIVGARRNEEPRALLDAGCGSGILAIAAAKLGYAPVEGFDFDPDAVRIAQENAALNDASVRLFEADVCRLPLRSRGRFDVVCANLTHDLLVAQRQRLANRLKAGGTLVLAGILVQQFDAVRVAYEGIGLRLVAARTVGEWRSGAFRRGPV